MQAYDFRSVYLEMIFNSRWSKAIVSAFWVALTAAAWLAFAPVPAGGLASYILVVGNSMEPNFHRGDLIIVHQASTYNSRDIVAYRNKELKSNVFHRIITQEYGHYTLQGDNNSWLDSYRPSREEVIGKLWIRIPQLGFIIQLLRKPINMALFAAASVSILSLTLLTTRPKGYKHMTKKSIHSRATSLLGRLGLPRKKSAETAISSLKIVSSGHLDDPTKSQRPRDVGNVFESLFFLFGFMAVASFIVGILSFTRPAFVSEPEDVSYQHLGVFSYTAAGPSSVYDSGTLQTGEPIFPGLTCSISLSFQYYLVGERVEDLAGTYSIIAQIIEPQTGWKRNIPLEVESAFRGNMFSSQNDLNMCSITTLIEKMEAETGFHPGQYHLFIAPRVSLHGEIQGQEFIDVYEPSLLFRFDRVNFSVVKTELEGDPFNQFEPGFVREMRSRANTIPFLGTQFAVPALRILALVGLIVSLTGIAALWVYMRSLMRQSPEAVIRMKYNTMIVDIQNGRLKLNAQAVEVLSMDDLAHLAERYDAMILHEKEGSIHKYAVNINGLLYLYANDGTRNQNLSDSTIQLSRELKRALEQGEFQLHYQPIVSLADGRITAVEALLRWQHPQKGLISARDFIPAAKHTGLIEELDQWVLQAACTELKHWQDSGIDLKLAVNLSNHDPQNNSAKYVHHVLETTGVKPQSLQIEIPETDILENSSALLPQMRELKSMGVNIAMDDFSGASAISSFSQYPISSVKIGRVAVKRLDDPEQAVSIQQMIMVARKLGLEVAAIGVETIEQKALLDAQDCFQAQGFLLGHPVPAQEIIELFRKREPLEYSKSTISN